jgi:hypothetical protein
VKPVRAIGELRGGASSGSACGVEEVESDADIGSFPCVSEEVLQKWKRFHFRRRLEQHGCRES